MKQIPVTKIIKTSSGETRRDMTIPENIWDKIVNGDAAEANTTYELRKVENKPATDGDVDFKDSKAFKAITIAELKEKLLEKQIVFNEDDNKTTLYKLYCDNVLNKPATDGDGNTNK